jgi:hypothetical protein
VSPQYDKSIEFLRKFHPDRLWVLTSISLDKKSIETRTFDFSRVDECRKWLELNGADRNIYFSIAEVDEDINKKAERTDLTKVWYLHVDIDPRAGEDIAQEQQRALNLLRNPPGLLTPTCIVFSGGGFQGFWALKHPIIINHDLDLAEEAKLYNLQIELTLQADHCHNVDRIMRLPGTINRPDPLKAKKGRQPALAQVVEWHDDAVYTIDQFTKAAVSVQTSGKALEGVASPNAPQVKVSGNIRRYTMDELPRGVTDKTKRIIQLGHDPDEPNKFSGRSEWLFHVCCELVRANCDDDTIYSVITDPKFGVSASVLDKGTMVEKYAVRQISRAKEDSTDPDLRELNDQFAIIGNWGGKCRVIEEQYDDVIGRWRLTKQSFDDFRNRHMNKRKLVGHGKSGDIWIDVGEWWLKHPRRREFDKIVFAPEMEVPNAYNLWRGFGVEERPGDCSLLLNHLKENICCGNTDHYDYLIKWMSYGVQRPNEQGHSCVVYRGGQGTGKSFAAKAFGSLFGRHFLQVTDPKYLVGSFNAHLRDCSVLFGDEAFYAGDKKHESILKMLITEEKLTIEAKGIDAEQAANCTHVILSSNEKWVVPVGVDDRRFFILKVGDKKKNNVPYFTAIKAQLDKDGRSAFLHHLRHTDLSGFNIHDVPKTAEHRIQKDFSMKPEEDWIMSLAKDGELPGTAEADKLDHAYSNHPDGVKPSLYKDARERVPKLRGISDKALSDILREWGFVNKKVGKGYQRANGWAAPPLSELRTKLDELYGKHEWVGGIEAKWGVEPEEQPDLPTAED